MKTFLLLATLVAGPAAAQAGSRDAQVFYASDTWPVHAAGASCTVSQAQPGPGGTLSVSYDGTQVALTSSNEVESPLPGSGKAKLDIVFLDNGSTRYDDGWSEREFTYRQEGAAYHFTTRFAGERNVRQILADLSASRTVGLLQDGQLVVDYDLAGLSPSIARLADCAARPVASN